MVNLKRTLLQFVSLKGDVQEFFISSQKAGIERGVLQTIELFCNGSPMAASLELDDFRIAAGMLPIIPALPNIPDHVKEAYSSYVDNKGARGWDHPDRAYVTEAVRRVRGLQ
jgi:hypothetical protein